MCTGGGWAILQRLRVSHVCRVPRPDVLTGHFRVSDSECVVFCLCVFVFVFVRAVFFFCSCRVLSVTVCSRCVVLWCPGLVPCVVLCPGWCDPTYPRALMWLLVPLARVTELCGAAYWRKILFCSIRWPGRACLALGIGGGLGPGAVEAQVQNIHRDN